MSRIIVDKSKWETRLGLERVPPIKALSPRLAAPHILSLRQKSRYRIAFTSQAAKAGTNVDVASRSRSEVSVRPSKHVRRTTEVKRVRLGSYASTSVLTTVGIRT